MVGRMGGTCQLFCVWGECISSFGKAWLKLSKLYCKNDRKVKRKKNAGIILDYGTPFFVFFSF